MATLTADMQQQIWIGDAALADLILEHNEAAQEAEDFRFLCPECAAGWTIDNRDPEEDDDAVCEACWAKANFTCAGCHQDCAIDDRHQQYPEYCTSCGDEHHAERVQDERSELDKILADWMDTEGELTKLKKLIAYAKRLK